MAIFPATVIDPATGSLAGADGIKIGDATDTNLVARPKIHGKTCMVTGWEEGSQVRIGVLDESTETWTFAKVGDAVGCEDATIAQINGVYCVISCSEGGASGQRVIIHWVPATAELLTSDAAWAAAAKTTITASINAKLHMQVEYLNDTTKAIACLSKDGSGLVGHVLLYVYGADPTDGGDWTLVELQACGWGMGLEVHQRWNSGAWSIVYSNRVTSRGLQALIHDGGADITTGWTHYELMDTDAAAGYPPFFFRDTPPGALRPTYYVPVNRATDRIYVLPEPADPTAVPWASPTDATKYLVMPDAPDLAATVQSVAVLGYDDDDFPIYACSGSKVGGDSAKYGVWKVERVAGTYRSENIYTDPDGEPDVEKFDAVQLFTMPGNAEPDIYICEEEADGGTGKGVLELTNPGNVPVPEPTFSSGWYLAGVKKFAEVGSDGIDWECALLMTNSMAGQEDDGIAVIDDFTTLDEFDGSGTARKPLTVTVTREDGSEWIKLSATGPTWATPGIGSRSVALLLLYHKITNDADSIPVLRCKFSPAQALTADNFTFSFPTNGFAQLHSPTGAYLAGMEVLATDGITGKDIRAVIVMDTTTTDTENAGIDTCADFAMLSECDGANYVAQELDNEAVTAVDASDRCEIHADDETWTSLGVGASPSEAIVWVFWNTDTAGSIPFGRLPFVDPITHDGGNLPVEWLSTGPCQLRQA